VQYLRTASASAGVLCKAVSRNSIAFSTLFVSLGLMLALESGYIDTRCAARTQGGVLEQGVLVPAVHEQLRVLAAVVQAVALLRRPDGIHAAGLDGLRTPAHCRTTQTYIGTEAGAGRPSQR